MQVAALAVTGALLGGCVASTPLHQAIESRDSTQSLAIIKTWKDVDVRDANGGTPLHSAARTGQTKTAKALVGRGAKVDLKDKEGETPLIEACAKGHGDTVRYLIEAGADVKEADSLGETCLIEAASGGHIDVVEAAIDHGASINHKNGVGRTALHKAATGSHDTTASHLIESGADLSAEDLMGVTPYDVAVAVDNVGMANSMLAAGATPNVYTDPVPQANWHSAESHFYAANYYASRDPARAKTYYRIAADHYDDAVEEWRARGRGDNGRIAGAILTTMVVAAINPGNTVGTPSVSDPIKARVEAGNKRLLAEERVKISREKAGIVDQ